MKVTINAVKDGPCILKINDQKVAVLCRCGASGNKPHCDGTHAKIEFKADDVVLDY